MCGQEENANNRIPLIEVKCSNCDKTILIPQCININLATIICACCAQIIPCNEDEE